MRTHNVAPTRVGREAARDPRLVFDLRRGRRPGRRLAARIETYLNGFGQ
jgi:hypothetical protein